MQTLRCPIQPINNGEIKLSIRAANPMRHPAQPTPVLYRHAPHAYSRPNTQTSHFHQPPTLATDPEYVQKHEIHAFNPMHLPTQPMLQTYDDMNPTPLVTLVGYVFDMSRHVFKTWRMSSLFRRHISQMSPNVATCLQMSPETCHMGGQKDMSLEDTSN